jgi:hypothetical protein
MQISRRQSSDVIDPGTGLGLIPPVPFFLEIMTKIDGFGLGLRPVHYHDFLEQKPNVDWLEIISENYMIPGGRPLHFLDAIRRDYPMVMHGVSLSIGSTDALDMDYLRQLKELINRVQPGWVSDHICWTGVDHANVHDLLPMPNTAAALDHLVARVQQVQEFLGQPLVLENASSYVAFNADEMPEWEFVAALARRSGCGLLLDVNNVYVSAVNHGFDAKKYIDAMPAKSVMQIHMAGHEDHGDYIIDTHDHPITEPVFELYRYTLVQLGWVPTMIERDDHIPPLAELLSELDQIRHIAGSVLQQQGKVA